MHLGLQTKNSETFLSRLTRRIFAPFIVLVSLNANAQSPAPLVEIQSETPGSIDFSSDQFSSFDREKQKKADALFEEVYKNPQSIPLNLQLALAQLQIGNLKAASATLERILEINPQEPQARLLLAQVESRLGNSVESKTFYQDVIDNPNASSLQKEAAQAELALLLESEKVWKYSGLIQAGIGRSLNPLSSPRYLTITGFDVLNPSYNPGYATTYMYYGSFSFERNLQTQSNDSLLASFSTYGQRYINSNPDVNYSLANLGVNTATFAYQSGAITDRFTIAWNSSETTLGNKGYMNSNWGTASYQTALGDNGLVNAGFNYGYNNQLQGQNYSGSSSRSNWMTGFALNGKYFMSANWLAEVNLSHYKYQATTSYESYAMNYELASLSYMSSYGTLGIFASNVSNQYADVDPISNLQRQIQTASYGASYAVALPTFTKPERKDLALTLSYQQGRANSNVQTYNTQTRQYMAILSKGF